ncbi:hypothetical protein LINGRAHAP2_LOCUS35479 [Linum grandiflorum]
MANGSVNNGDANEDQSRSDAKRSQQWFMDAAEAQLFPNKKQAVGMPTHNLFTGLLTSGVPPWGNPSSFQSMSGHFTDRLFEYGPPRPVNFGDRNVASVGSGNFDMARNGSSFGLSMSHTLEDPDARSGLNYSGIRKVKVSQVKEADSVMPVSHAYETRNEAPISMGLAYAKADGSGSVISGGESYGQDHSSFISMGLAYSKAEDNLSVNQSYSESNNSLAMGHAFSKVDNNVVPMTQTYNKAEQSIIPMGNMYSGGSESANLSMGHGYNKGESTIISFGGYDEDDPSSSGRLLSSYELLGQTSILGLDATNDKELGKSAIGSLVASARAAPSGTGSESRKKDDTKAPKKAPPNNFPSNVRSLLSTGILDGIQVKYVSWSREELRGVIRGSGYLCSCQACNFSKVINAYELERHANCKTKHPNNHIYFDNGKTIYGVVQELRSTPQHMLFDVMQTITGSPINQKCFRLWKDSFVAATQELQRIYGSEDAKPI